MQEQVCRDVGCRCAGAGVEECRVWIQGCRYRNIGYRGSGWRYRSAGYRMRCRVVSIGVQMQRYSMQGCRGTGCKAVEIVQGTEVLVRSVGTGI